MSKYNSFEDWFQENDPHRLRIDNFHWDLWKVLIAYREATDESTDVSLITNWLKKAFEAGKE